jgi:hypothetical protein
MWFIMALAVPAPIGRFESQRRRRETWHHGRRLSRLLLSLLLTLPMASLTCWAQAPVGSVIEIEGSAQLERGGHESEVTVRMEVQVHDRLKTMAHSHLTVSLRDGSRLMLAESSSMVIDQSAVAADATTDSTIELLTGHLRSIVNITAGASGKFPNFEVHTPNAVAGVRGTEFETAYIEGKPCPGFPTCLRYTDVGVYRGIVEVSNPGNPKALPVRVAGGYETTVPCEQPPTSPAPLGMGELGAPGYR